MIIQVSTLYPVKGMNEQAFGETIDSHSDGKILSLLILSICVYG